MWGGVIGLIIQLISGAVGGNIAGAAMNQYSLGTVGNSIAGLIGGGVGAQISAPSPAAERGPISQGRAVSISVQLSGRLPPAVSGEAF